MKLKAKFKKQEKQIKNKFDHTSVKLKNLADYLV